jgi:hypothetical protein
MQGHRTCIAGGWTFISLALCSDYGLEVYSEGGGGKGLVVVVAVVVVVVVSYL